MDVSQHKTASPKRETPALQAGVSGEGVGRRVCLPNCADRTSREGVVARVVFSFGRQRRIRS
jgi:hypothetical protein